MYGSRQILVPSRHITSCGRSVADATISSMTAMSIGLRPSISTIRQTRMAGRMKSISLPEKLRTQLIWRSILDIGCGSGFKLVKYLYNRTTIGVDIAETCARLQKRYPRRPWAISDFSAAVTPKADLVIASDVIEHLADPDELLDFIVRVAPKYVVISTPDRNLLRVGTHNGPPSNPAHLREWSMADLDAYVSEFLEVIEHFVSYAPQATQCVLAKSRS